MTFSRSRLPPSHAENTSAWRRSTVTHWNRRGCPPQIILFISLILREGYREIFDHSVKLNYVQWLGASCVTRDMNESPWCETCIESSISRNERIPSRNHQTRQANTHIIEGKPNLWQINDEESKEDKVYSKAFDRDYDFYLRNKDTLSFAGVDVGKDIVHDPENGMDVKECFYRMDTRGEKCVATREPELLKQLVSCKKSVNLHIKMCVEGYEDMMEGVDFYMDNCLIDPPPWVADSFRKQLRQKFMKGSR